VETFSGIGKKFTKLLKGHETIKEVPKGQRYINRPILDCLFKKGVIWDVKKRNEKIREAVEMYGYSQKEIADHLQMHYSSISRLLRNE